MLALAIAAGCSDAPTNGNVTVEQQTFDIASAAQPADTPGSTGVVVTNPKLLAQFGGAGLTLNRNFVDLYYPSSGLGVTSVAGQCAGGSCVVGNVGASCTVNSDCSQSVNLDSSALSIGRGRRDIANLTQAAAIDLPVIAVAGTNGLATVPGVWIPFARSIGACRAPSCDGAPRIVDPSSPSAAFPTYGDAAGGFEVVVGEGYTHLDVLTAEDDDDNPIVRALAAFLARNAR